MRSILVIGGTGTMGREVVRRFSEIGYETWCVCRSKSAQLSPVHYLYGNAMDNEFLFQVLERREYDAIVDFMWYDPDTFASRINQLLSATKHYICLSSSAVSAHSNKPIKEDNLRFYDIVSEKDLNDKGWHYHLDKARIENILHNQTRINWSIIRPHVTLNSNHLPLTIWAENVWLWRAVHNLPIVLYEDLLKPLSSYTMADDVARMIKAIIINCASSFGETYNVVSDTILSGEQLLNLYRDILHRHGINMKIVRFSDSSSYRTFSPLGYERISYDRAKDRVFDNTKIKAIEDIQFSNFEKSMEKCIVDWLSHVNSNNLEDSAISGCAFMDQLSNTRTPIRYFKTFKSQKNYLMYRYPLIRKIYNAVMQPIAGILKQQK